MTSVTNRNLLLQEGMRLFLNRAWLNVCPKGEYLSRSELVIFYCLFIEVGTLSVEEFPRAVSVFEYAFSNLITFFKGSQVEMLHFGHLEKFIKSLTGVEASAYLNLTKEDALERISRFQNLSAVLDFIIHDFEKYDLKFESTTFNFVERSQTFYQEPNSSWDDLLYYEDKENIPEESSHLKTPATSELQPRIVFRDLNIGHLDDPRNDDSFPSSSNHIESYSGPYLKDPELHLWTADDREELQTFHFFPDQHTSEYEEQLDMIKSVKRWCI